MTLRIGIWSPHPSSLSQREREMRLGTTVPSQFQRARRLPPTVDSRRGFWQTVFRGEATGEERTPPAGPTTAQGRGDGTAGTLPPPHEGDHRRRRRTGRGAQGVGGLGRSACAV